MSAVRSGFWAVLRVLVPLGAQGCMLLVGTNDYTTDGGASAMNAGGASATSAAGTGASATSAASTGASATSTASTGASATSTASAGATGDDEGPGMDASSPQPITLQGACTDLETALCNKIESCDPFYITETYGTVAGCVQRSLLACPLIAAAPSDIEACAQSTPAETCDQLFSNNEPAACNYVGPMPQGGACSQNAQCDTRTEFCEGDPGQTCGVCAPRVGAMGACSDDSVCQLGLSCAIPSGDTLGTCAVPAAAGEECDDNQPCAGTLVCTENGVCGLALEVGAACASQECDESQGVFCDTELEVCTQYQAASPGDACGFCAASGFCRTDSDLGTGTCLAAAADGTACDATNGPLCTPPAACTNGLCELPVAQVCN
jgi:hypothetical protein